MRPVVEESNKYAAKDKKYTSIATPATMSKFGPSGSLKNKNSALEHAKDVAAKIATEIFFEIKYIAVIVLEIYELSLVDKFRMVDWAQISKEIMMFGLV